MTDSIDKDVQISTEHIPRIGLDIHPPALRAKEVHVWELAVEVPDAIPPEYQSLLSADEEARAQRFHFEKDRDRYVMTRHALRVLLGAYTATPAASLKFAYSKHGKPSIDNQSVHFSVSHSGTLAMIAVATDVVGVDIEAIREDIEIDKLAERFFSELERTCIRELPEDRRVHAFFRCWSSKEAFLKADGIGLSRPLNSFDVEVNPHKKARLIATRPMADEANLWFLQEIPTREDYAAAVALHGLLQSVRIFRTT